MQRVERGSWYRFGASVVMNIWSKSIGSMVASGLTNAQIAAELVVSPKTVSAHVEHILAKLGVARRTEIATWATTVRGAGAPVTSTGLSTAGTG